MQQLMDVKQATRRTWATGDYDGMMRQEGLYEVGARIVAQVDVGADDEVLDIACGTGNAAIPAAEAGARVTGIDLTPEMLEIARRRADQAAVEVEWVEGDAEQMPFDDARFDVVLSTFGVMFAPRHEVVVDEIARVLRPGGRMGLCSWTPDGVFGEFFAVVGAFLPPPPEVVDAPLSFGDESRVRDLFEGAGISLEFERAVSEVPHPSVEAAVECYTTKLGPVVEASDEAEAKGRLPELRRGLTRLFEAADSSTGPGVVLPAEYLVISGRKAG